MALIGALAALALGILAYFNPVIAAVTALYLLIEDLAVWKAGGKSTIGTLVGQGGKLIEGIQGGMSISDALKNATSMAGGASAQISHAQNMTQNNYMAFGSADAVPIAQKANDLMFAMMQVDRTA